MGQIFFELRGEIDTEWVFVDGSYIRAHQHASGARHNEERAIGKFCGGATTKIHISADAHGNPLDFEITGGEIHDAKVADILIKKIGAADNFIADKGYDSKTIREQAKKAGMNPVIAKRLNFDYNIDMSYSIDFRRKVLSIREKEGLSIRETAKRFHIGSASV